MSVGQISWGRILFGPCRAPPRAAEHFGAGIRAGFLYGTGARVELAMRDILVGPVGVGFPLFDFLPGFRLGPRPGFRFGHVFCAFLLNGTFLPLDPAEENRGYGSGKEHQGHDKKPVAEGNHQGLIVDGLSQIVRSCGLLQRLGRTGLRQIGLDGA